MSNIKAFCFDLFDTLADAHRSLEQTESDALGVTRQEWNAAMWEEKLCYDRGMGYLPSIQEMIDRACAMLPVMPSKERREAAAAARCERFRLAVTEIDPRIVAVIRTLKARGFMIGLVSNADLCDCLNWPQSPLFPSFDDSIFSCDVHLLKPDREIYLLSAGNLGVRPEEAVFVGDGGSDELSGAKAVGMKTVCTEYLRRHEEEKRREIHRSADRIITQFEELLDIR